MGTIRVLSPVAECKVSQEVPRPLPTDLGGKTIGFLDNTKANFDRLTREMEARLRERYGLAGAVYQRKANAATPAPAEVLEALAGVDLVITGSADWGSCTSWSLHDAVTLERAGTPTAVVTTTAFETLAHHEAYALGMEGLPLLVIDHPLGGESPEQVAEKAARAVAQLAARLGR